MLVIPAQPNPSELLHLVTYWVPLHHIGDRSPCSYRLCPVDGDTVLVSCDSHVLRRPGCKTTSVCKRLHLGLVLLPHVPQPAPIDNYLLLTVYLYLVCNGL